jgi:4-hydroxybenzoate polyprenyltransferase
MSGSKKSGYKDYYILMRPKAFFATNTLFALTGYVFGLEGVRSASQFVRDFGVMYFAYAICLVAGTFAFNSACDRDQGPIGYIDAPPPPPRYLARFSIALMLAGVAICFTRGALTVACAVAIFLLSIAYSWSPVRGLRRIKDVPGADAILNGLGGGALSVIFGYSLTHQPMTARIGFVALAFTVWFVGTYPASQIYQLDPTGWRTGPQNCTTLLGPARALRASTVFLVSAWSLLAVSVDRPFLFGRSHAIATAFYAVFCLLFFREALRLAIWSKRPFEGAKEKVHRLWPMILLARSCWICAHTIDFYLKLR